MNPALQKLVDRIESQRQLTLDSIKGLSEKELNQSPAEGKWSVAEILSHLIAAERLSILYIQKKIQGIQQAGTSGLWEEIKIVVLIVSQRIPGLTFRAPPRVVENTPQYKTFPEILAAWSVVRSELKLLVEKMPDSALSRLIYKHPAAGYLSIRHALIFFYEHVYHHGPQLKRLAKLK